MTGSARTGLHRMRAIRLNHIDRTRTDARHPALEVFNLILLEAAFEALGIPRGMSVVAEHEFGADAADFAGGARRLDVAQVREKVEGVLDAFGNRWIFRRLDFEFEEIEHLLTGSEEPAEGVGEREGDALPRAVIKRVAISVMCDLQ